MSQPTRGWKGGKGSGYTRVPQAWTVNRGSEAICQVMELSIRCLDAILPTQSRPPPFAHSCIHSLTEHKLLLFSRSVVHKTWIHTNSLNTIIPMAPVHHKRVCVCVLSHV